MLSQRRQDLEDYRHGAHTVFEIHLHLVWTTKKSTTGTEWRRVPNGLLGGLWYTRSPPVRTAGDSPRYAVGPFSVSARQTSSPRHLRAVREIRSHLARRESHSAAPTTEHSRPRWVAALGFPVHSGGDQRGRNLSPVWEASKLQNPSVLLESTEFPPIS
jgi:hypothetical protein